MKPFEKDKIVIFILVFRTLNKMRLRIIPASSPSNRLLVPYLLQGQQGSQSKHIRSLCQSGRVIYLSIGVYLLSYRKLSISELISFRLSYLEMAKLGACIRRANSFFWAKFIADRAGLGYTVN